MQLKFHDNQQIKEFSSPDYHYLFSLKSGKFLRFGRTINDDPQIAPAPEILDIEITTKCPGVKDVRGIELPCKFCYKSNTVNGQNMSFETFKGILDKFPRFNDIHFLTQIAFGADSHATSNPDLWKMMAYARSQYVVPNITVADISDETADNLTKYCGAVAVSRYENKDLCYDSVKRLIDRGMKQVNIHILVSQETETMIWETLRDRLTDPRLADLNAIVLLSLKQRGRGKDYTVLPQENFKKIVDFALENKIGCGFDSCSCDKFLQSIQNRKDKNKLGMMSEPCESTLMSLFIDVNGFAHPCSFACGAGVDVKNCVDFTRDIWYNEKIVEFRRNLLNGGRNCPLYQI